MAFVVKRLSSKKIDTVTQVEILNEVICITYNANTLRKCINPAILPQAIGLVLWHINLCRLFNTQFIKYKWTFIFRTVRFSLSTQVNFQKHFYSKLFSLVSVLFQTIQLSISIFFFVHTQLNVKTVLFQAIQLSIQKHFHFKQFSLAQVRSLNIKTILFQAIRF